VKTVPLGSLCELRNGRAFKSEEWSDYGTPIVRIQNLNDESKPFNYCRFEVEPKFWVNSGDLLFSWSGTPGTSFGAFFWNRGRGFLNQHIFRVDTNEKVDKSYLRYALNSLISRIIDHAHGGVGLKHITKSKLEGLEIPLPQLAEQRRIAAILDKADALRAKRREAIAKLDQLLQSVFLDMFGDPVANPKGWPTATLSSLAREKMSNGIFRKNENYSDAGLPVVWVEDLFRGHVLKLSTSRVLVPSGRDIESYGLLPGDILFCRSSLKLDGIAYNNVYLGSPNEALFECHLIRLRVREDLVDPVFLNYLLRNGGVREQIKSRAKTSTMTTIDQKGLGDVQVVIPTLKLQKEFRTALNAWTQHLEWLNMQLLSVNNLFGSLQQRAFAGML